MVAPVNAAALLTAIALAAWGLQADRIDAILDDRLAGVPDAGVVAVIIDGDDRKLVTRGKAAGGTLDASTSFDVGGLADVFVGVALADMVAKGEIDLRDPVAKHLHGVAVPTRGGRSITLEDLAVHRSGLPRLLPGLSRTEALQLTAYTRERLASFLAEHQLTRDIGTQYHRSPLGTGLLAAAIAARAGTSIEELLQTRVFAPLGLVSTVFRAGALRSTPNDLAEFVAANLRPSGPLAGRLDDARSSRGNIGLPGEALGLGWRIRTIDGRRLEWGSGAAGGNQALVALEPAAGRGVVVLHTQPLGVDDVAFRILDELHDATTALDPSLLTAFAGEYEVRRGFLIVVRVADRKLAVRVGDEPESTLAHEEGVRFVFEDSDARMTFVRDPAGAIIGLILHRGSQHTGARRVR